MEMTTTMDTLTVFLGWCTVINFAVLMWWFVMVVLLRGPIHAIHNRIYTLSDAQFNGLHYGGMGLFKMIVVVFNLVPYLVLKFFL